MIDPTSVAAASLSFRGAVRIIRSIYPPIDLFEDIADPADWPHVIAAEQKTNARLAESVGNLDLVPPGRRVGGVNASYLMAPFTHVTPDRTSRFCDGTFGVLYAGEQFEVALRETVHHHARFMARTNEPAGWTSQFREVVMDISGDLHDLRPLVAQASTLLSPDDYGVSQVFARALRSLDANGLVYPSVRCPGGACVGLFYPDLAANPRQGRHLDYHWNGLRVDYYRDPTRGEVFAIS